MNGVATHLNTNCQHNCLTHATNNAITTCHIRVGKHKSAFDLNNTELGSSFLAHCEAYGVHGLKGHRSIGGYRASLYNALSLESVNHLIDCLKDFEKKTFT